MFFNKNHKCILNEEKTEIDKLHWCHKIRLVFDNHPLTTAQFRSSTAIKNEQLRHLNTSSVSIHPFSKFRAWYEMYLIYLYMSLLLTKPVDAGFMRITHDNTKVLPYRYYTIITDFLCLIDIILNFFMGYESRTKNTIELRVKCIARNYVFSSLFFFDLISSIPKCLFVYAPRGYALRPTLGIVSICNLFKIIRIVSILKCIKRTSEFCNVKSKGAVFVFSSLLVSFMIVHWMACMQFAVPKFFRLFFVRKIKAVSWYDTGNYSLKEKDVPLQYIHALFKSSAFILGIRIFEVYNERMPEEYVLAIFTYFLGKILIAVVWIILAVSILNARIMDIKFAESINELGEYMRQRQLPKNLQKRILQYFTYKYQKKYHKEHLVSSMLSDNLRREANMHACKSLIKNVPLFRKLSNSEVTVLVDHLVPEIFLPNDNIVNAGGQGDAMYFLSSGTVAVYTRSGREVCHLQDGAYFGEVALLVKGQTRIVTVKALETCHVYRLHKTDFNKFLMSNKAVKESLLKNAETRLRNYTKLEEEFKVQMMEQTFRKIDTTSTMEAVD